MSWALEEWKSELSSRARQKVSEYESQLEKLKRERQQKQLQLDSLEVAFQKQNQKLEGERGENATLRREAQGLTEARNNLEKAQQRLCHEVQVKEALVCSLEGQLLATRKQIDGLEQELKRLEAELERSQRASTPAECQLHLTPAKIYPVYATLSSANEASKWDELHEKYNREAEEKRRLTCEVKALKLQVQQLQFSSNRSHRESAPQHIRASTLSWQPEKSPTRVPESPVGRGPPSSVFPWEQPRTPPYCNPKSPQQSGNKTSSPGSESGNGQLSQLEEPGNAQLQELRKENQVLQSTMSELEVWVQSQEKEIKNHLNKLQEVQSHLERSKAELATKEQALSQCRDHLMKATMQQEQTSSKCAILEQKLKQVSEDLSCQRQNAESVRRQMEQKSKDKEKEHQQELSEQQRAYRNLEHQCKQEKNQLNQEIQKLKSEHLALQSTIDKEALKEKDRFSSWQDQSTQRITHLEAQLKRLEKQLILSQRSRDEIKTENLTLASKLKDLQQRLDGEFQPTTGSEGLAASACELNKEDQNEIGECELAEEGDGHRSNQFDGAATVVGWPVTVGEENVLDLVEGSKLGELEPVVTPARSDQDGGAHLEEDPSLSTGVTLEVVPGGASGEARGSEGARDVFPDPREKAGVRFQELGQETKEVSNAGGGENAVVPREPAEKGDRLDQPIAVSARLAQREVELDEVKAKNQLLQQELDHLRQALDGKVTKGQESQQTVAEAECSSALVTLQAGQIGGLEKELEHERTKVAKLLEANKGLELQCSRVSELAGSGGTRSDEDEIQVLQGAASKKMRLLEQQIVELNRERSCIEEIAKANGWPAVGADESSDLLLESPGYKDVRSRELNEPLPNRRCCDPREMLKRRLNEEKTNFLEIVKGFDGRGDGQGGRELFLEYLRHKVAQQLEADRQTLERRKLLGELEQKCKELGAEKEQEEREKRQAEERFDSLQAKIHRETQQLTVALEVQSKNIEGLLLSMEEKDQTIRVLTQRLQNASKVLSCLQKENCKLKANLQEISAQRRTEDAGLPGDAVLGQTRGAQFPLAEQQGNGDEPSMGRFGSGEQAPPIKGGPVDGTVQNSEAGHDENAFDNSSLQSTEHLLPTQGGQFEEFKVPSLSAVREMPEVREDPDKQAQQIIKIQDSPDAEASAMPKEQGSNSFLTTKDKPEMTSEVKPAWQNIIRLTRDAEGTRLHEELDCVQSNGQQSIRCPDGFQMKIGELEEELMTLRIERSPGETETLTEGGASEIADSKLALLLEERLSVDELRTEAELIEEVERVTGRLSEALQVSEEEHRKTKELNLKAVGALNGELTSVRERCAALEREREQLRAEVRKAQEAAGDLRDEKEDLLNALRSGEALLRQSTEDGNRVERELVALREGKRKVSADSASGETAKDSDQVERRASQGMQNQMQELEEECKALKSAVATAKHSQQQRQGELEQTQSEKSELQSQVDRLQRVAAQLNEEKMELQAKLKQLERSPVDKEEIPADVMRENGLGEDLLPVSSQQQGTAQITASRLGADLEALRQTLQAKSEEANRNLFSYSDLLDKRQALQAANTALFKAVNHLHQCKAETLNGDPRDAVDPELQASTEDQRPVSGQQIGAQAGEERDRIETSQVSKGHTDLGGHLRGLNPADIMMKINAAELATRIQRNRQFRHRLSVAFDETDYEPYGLPDVVQKGFADIPSGPSCPHILRRATLNSTFCPQKQGEGQSLFSFFKALGGSSKD
ncbi:uncharacterized protein LOC144481792 isoform X2 [Mustelus asterias]